MAWIPQPGPQTSAILTANFVDELLFGGARGGGKSDYLLGDFGQDVGKGYEGAWKGVLMRRSIPQLEQLMNRSKQIYYDQFPGAVFNGTKHIWTFPGGETLKFQHMAKESMAELMQGDAYSWLGFDELGNWATMAHWNSLKATLRSAVRIPCKRMRGSANPGGRGHLTIKQYFGIDEYPLGSVPITDPKTGMIRMFIKSRVSDNKIMMESDPGYVDRLKGTGSEALVRAWLEGDWDAIIGAYFDCWRSALHTVEPFPIPLHWVRFRAYDWGFSSPGCVQWWAVASEEAWHPDGFIIPKGALVCYREWYIVDDAGAGARYADEAIAHGIKARERNDPDTVKSKTGQKVDYSVADPSIWNARPAGLPGKSIAETMADNGVIFRPADNSRQAGWQQLRSRFLGIDQPEPNMPGTPMIYWFNTCHASIRTLPSLQHDELDPEDLDTEGEDHAADTVRYACMSRPWERPQAKPAEPIKGLDGLTLDRLFQEASRNRRRGNRRASA